MLNSLGTKQARALLHDLKSDEVKRVEKIMALAV